MSNSSAPSLPPHSLAPELASAVPQPRLQILLRPWPVVFDADPSGGPAPPMPLTIVVVPAEVPVPAAPLLHIAEAQVNHHAAIAAPAMPLIPASFTARALARAMPDWPDSDDDLLNK